MPGLLFLSAKRIEHDVFGDCRMEVWRDLDALQPTYETRYYKGITLVDTERSDEWKLTQAA